MTDKRHSQNPPPQYDIALTLPPLSHHVVRTKVTAWFQKPWGRGFAPGEPLAKLATGEIVRAPCAGYLRWHVPVGTRVRIGDRLALIRPLATASTTTVQLGMDVALWRPVEVTTEELASGCYILGVQGMGKSSLLEEIVRQLLDLSESVIVFDPHGKLIDDIVIRMPAHRLADTYLLDLKDRDYPFGLNIFACADAENEEERDRTRNQVMHAFAKIWPETASQVYFKKLLRHIVILLIEQPHLTLADVPRLLSDAAFRTHHTNRLRNQESRHFWEFGYGRLSPSQQQIQTRSLLDRVDELLVEPVITRILCQPQSTINFRQLIEQRKNLLIRLPINEDAYAKAAELIGTMLMAGIYAATFSFADVPEEERPGFSLVVDEFQNFATDEYARLFAQGRKFKVKQFLAHQYREQLADVGMESTKPATLTAQIKIVFAVTKADAKELADDFASLPDQRQRSANLDIAPLAAMRRHPHPAVKEFVIRYGQSLEAGMRDKVVRGDGDPWRDFGGGNVNFWPAEVADVVRLLNNLLYQTQQTGRVDPNRERAVLYRMMPLLGGADNKPALRAFLTHLRDVLQVLMREPIAVGRTAADKDVRLELQHLPKRQAYIRVGTKTAIMQTLPMPAPVSEVEAARRSRQLQEQTRRDLCRPGPEEPPTAAAAPRPKPRPPVPPRSNAQNTPVASVTPLRPRTRRSQPLPPDS